MNATHAEQERARAEAVAAAEKNARERLVAETARGEKFARELAVKTAELDAERVRKQEDQGCIRKGSP